MNGMNRLRVLLVFFLTAILVACASNDELFAQYDELCDHHRLTLIANASSVSYLVHESPEEDESSGSYPLLDNRLGQVIWHPAVFFSFDEDSLSAEEMARLDDNVTVLKTHEHLTMQLRGFADEQGPAAYNKDLSSRRAAQVAKYLVSQGISASRISQTELGESLPIAQRGRVPDFEINRRVEFFLLDEAGAPVPIIFTGAAQ